MTTDTVGGVFTYAVDLADGLRRHGVRVLLATMGRPMSVEQRRLVREAGVLEVHESTFPLEWLKVTYSPPGHTQTGPDTFGPFSWQRMPQS